MYCLSWPDIVMQHRALSQEPLPTSAFFVSIDCNVYISFVFQKYLLLRQKFLPFVCSFYCFKEQSNPLFIFILIFKLSEQILFWNKTVCCIVK